ncbi:MAG: hypothetical protein K9N07_09635 [Candidatus Cloacimonetes bacterium]|nr:hypothetical protein [Candidatus Cloacimonadota bacterium]
MKKVIIVFFAIVSILYSQAPDYNSGKITLTIDDKEITVPVESVSIRKLDNILISVQGRNKAGDEQQNVYLEFGMKNFGGGEIPDEQLSLKVDVKTSRFYVFTFSLQNGNAHYSSIPERFIFDDVSTQFNIDSVEYKNGSIIISGNFNGLYSSAGGKSTTTGKTEIKNGAFEIIF